MTITLIYQELYIVIVSKDFLKLEYLKRSSMKMKLRRLAPGVMHMNQTGCWFYRVRPLSHHVIISVYPSSVVTVTIHCILWFHITHMIKRNFIVIHGAVIVICGKTKYSVKGDTKPDAVQERIHTKAYWSSKNFSY